MGLKLFLSIALCLELGQHGFSLMLPSNKLDNGDYLLGSILKNSPPLTRLELITKCNACKRQNKCKLQDCQVCDEICNKNQLPSPHMSKLKKPSEIVGINLRTAEHVKLSDKEDRYYTVGAFKDGPVQHLLQRLLNLNVRGPTDHIVVMVKPKSKQPHHVHNPIIIDTAHIFTPNEGDAKMFEMELHKVGNVDKNTEELVEKLDRKFEHVVEQKHKTNMDSHLTPEEIDDIIEQTIEEERRPVLTSRVMDDDEDEIPLIGYQQTNTNSADGHHIRHQHRNQGDQVKIMKGNSETVAAAPVVQPPYTYEDADKSAKVPMDVISPSARAMSEKKTPHMKDEGTENGQLMMSKADEPQEDLEQVQQGNEENANKTTTEELQGKTLRQASDTNNRASATAADENKTNAENEMNTIMHQNRQTELQHIKNKAQEKTLPLPVNTNTIIATARSQDEANVENQKKTGQGNLSQSMKNSEMMTENQERGAANLIQVNEGVQKSMMEKQNKAIAEGPFITAERHLADIARMSEMSNGQESENQHRNVANLIPAAKGNQKPIMQDLNNANVEHSIIPSGKHLAHITRKSEIINGGQNENPHGNVANLIPAARGNQKSTMKDQHKEDVEDPIIPQERNVAHITRKSEPINNGNNEHQHKGVGNLIPVSKDAQKSKINIQNKLNPEEPFITAEKHLAHIARKSKVINGEESENQLRDIANLIPSAKGNQKSIMQDQNKANVKHPQKNTEKHLAHITRESEIINGEENNNEDKNGANLIPPTTSIQKSIVKDQNKANVEDPIITAERNLPHITRKSESLNTGENEHHHRGIANLVPATKSDQKLIMTDQNNAHIHKPIITAERNSPHVMRTSELIHGDENDHQQSRATNLTPLAEGEEKIKFPSQHKANEQNPIITAENNFAHSTEKPKWINGKKHESAIKPIPLAEVVQKSSEMFQNKNDGELLRLKNSEHERTNPGSKDLAGSTKIILREDQENSSANKNLSTQMDKEKIEIKSLPSSTISEEIPSHTTIKLVPSSNPRNILDNIQADVEKSASNLVEDATTSAKQTNDKINDMLQQIFPEPMRNLQEIKLKNNQKYLTNLNPEEQMVLSRKMNEPVVGLMPQSQDVYKKHPRIETLYSKGTFVTTKTPPSIPPYHSKHRDADAMGKQSEFVEMTQQTNDATPFIDKNLLNMNSVINNAQKVPDAVLENVRKGLNILKHAAEVKVENPEHIKSGNSKNTDETVGCKKEEDKYLKVDPATPYDNMYRTSGLHLPTIKELLHPNTIPHPRPLDLPVKDIDKLPKVHHSELPLYKANIGSSEDQEDEEGTAIAESMVESRHRNKNSNNYRHLGKLIPKDHFMTKRDTSEHIKQKDMFFIGDGIKLPLTLREFTDGSLHLSIDVKALCNCKHCNSMRRNDATEIIGVVQSLEKEVADIPLKVYNDDNKPANAVRIISRVSDDAKPEGMEQSSKTEEKAGVNKRSIWDNRIEKIDEASISPEKFHFLKDIFKFMKNLVSEDIDIH